MTRSTCGISRPRAATSVVSRMLGCAALAKRAKFLVRTFGGCLPWRGTRVKAVDGEISTDEWLGERMVRRMCWK